MSAYTEIFHSRPTRAQIEREREALNAHCRGLAGTMPGCAPWCAYHAYEEGWSEFPGICYSDPQWMDGKAPYLVDEHTEGHGLLVWWPEREEAAVEDAEAFARRILVLVAMARAENGGAA